MKNIIIVLLLSSSIVHAQMDSELSIIPEPSSVQRLKANFNLTPQVKLCYNDNDAKAAAVLLNEFLFSNYGFRLPLQMAGTTSSTTAITVTHDQATASEAYSLDIRNNSIRLSGDAAGLFYGIQTLQQLFPLQKTAHIILPALIIKDQPRFAYRGLMLDVCRHFYPVSYIKKFLDVMSHFKLNTFHWHLTDDQGWRIEIKKYPALQQGDYYTQQEIKEIVAYAATRHITIIPEIEMPGHSSAALAAYPSLGCTGGPYKVQTTWGIFHDVYCAGNDSVFTFLQGVIDEVVSLFPGRYIHIGGDECPKDSWKKCPKCQQRIAANQLKDEHELQSYFVQRIEKYINSKGRKMIGWDEILEGGLAPNATVMSWRGEKGGIEAARLQHDVIMTPYTYLYFDYYQGNPSLEPKAIGGFLPLEAVYKYEPLSDEFTTTDHQYVKGIQANTWTEFIADENHLDYMVYPRALVVAETGWSPATQKNYAHFLQKLHVRLAALEKQYINFRIPEPVGLKDSVTTLNKITINLQPSVKGAVVYYTTDGTIPTTKSAKATGYINLSLFDNIPVTVKTITVLPSGRQSRVQAANYISKPLQANAPASAQQKYVYMPVIDGDWWNITNNPDLGAITSPKQEPVDFAVWQAADGTWQLWSCIRGTKAGGFTRLFYRWEAKHIADTNWVPKGMAMQADTTLGEAQGGLQAPFVFKEKDTWYMVYGDWNHICLAKSRDGKNFTRVVNKAGSPALFSGPMNNTRDPMILKEGNTYYCYYTSHLEKDDPAFPIKSAVFCRTSKDLITWSEPKLVADGGSAAKQTSWYGGDAECPFVVKVQDRYILFRNQRYGRNHLNTQYCSADPLHFGIDSDEYMVGQLPVAAPEIIKVKDQYYIVALKPGLDGMRMAKLKFVKKEVASTVKSRIIWDENTLQKVSAPGKGYCGYARLIQLQDKSLLCTYEADGSVVTAKSSDGGKTWSPPITVAPRENGYNMAVPDLLQLKDGSVLICYNPRPYQQSTDRKFAIRTKKSYDGGLTWKEERLLYEAGHEFKNGCWEPSAIQLPGGEIQLYFANEGVYLNSNEQNISLLRSRDNGLTWTTPEMVSFRAGSRDGMPVPLLLQNGKEIVYAIEDNGVGNFKPYIIRTRVEENWSAPVLSDAADRNYALAEKIPDSIYAGAPYLRQLSTGETILSYQGTEGRPNKMNNAEMKVVIGTADARNFTNKTSPFKIPPSRSGLWNSISIIDKDVVVALTSTNAFSENGATEVWMIKGRVIR